MVTRRIATTAAFDKLEGRFNAKFDLTANGASPAAIVSSLGDNAEGAPAFEVIGFRSDRRQELKHLL